MSPNPQGTKSERTNETQGVQPTPWAQPKGWNRTSSVHGVAATEHHRMGSLDAGMSVSQRGGWVSEMRCWHGEVARWPRPFTDARLLLVLTGGERSSSGVSCEGTKPAHRGSLLQTSSLMTHLLIPPYCPPRGVVVAWAGHTRSRTPARSPGGSASRAYPGPGLWTRK